MISFFINLYRFVNIILTGVKKDFRFLLIFLLILCSMGCSTQSNSIQEQKGIIYTLPVKVQQLLRKKVDGNKKVYFVLDKKDSLEYRIYVNNLNEKLPRKNWIDNSNRYLYLDGKIYPLTFTLDEDFAHAKSIKDFLQNIKKDGSYETTKISIIRHAVYCIDFTTIGEILYEGYQPKDK